MRADDADVVGLGGMLVEKDRIALGRGAQADDLHRSANGHADDRFGDAVAFEELPLPLGGAAAVAAHRRHEEGRGPEIAQKLDGAVQDDGDVGDAAAAGGEGDGLARADALLQVQLVQGFADGGGDIVDARSIEPLADANHTGIAHNVNLAFRIRRNAGDAGRLSCSERREPTAPLPPPVI